MSLALSDHPLSYRFTHAMWTSMSRTRAFLQSYRSFCSIASDPLVASGSTYAKELTQFSHLELTTRVGHYELTALIHRIGLVPRHSEPPWFTKRDLTGVNDVPGLMCKGWT